MIRPQLHYLRKKEIYLRIAGKDLKKYSYKKLPFTRHEEYFNGEINKKNYKIRKFNYTFTFYGELEGEYNEYGDIIGSSYSRIRSGCAYLNFSQILKLKYFHNELWCQKNSNIKWLIQILFAPVIVSLITTLITLYLRN